MKTLTTDKNGVVVEPEEATSSTSEDTARPQRKAPNKARNTGANNSTNAEPEVKVFSPRDLIGYEGPLYVKNLTDTTVSWDDGKEVLKLQRSGNEDSVGVLSPSIARHPKFQQFWRKGKVLVTNDPDVEEDFDRYASDQLEVERLEQSRNQTVVIQQTSIPMPDWVSKNITPVE